MEARIIAHSYAGLYVTPMMAIVGIIVSVNVKNLDCTCAVQNGDIPRGCGIWDNEIGI